MRVAYPDGRAAHEESVVKMGIYARVSRAGQDRAVLAGEPRAYAERRA